MQETLLNVFEGFCDDLPETVRDDLLFMMVMLSDEDLVVDELDDIDERARAPLLHVTLPCDPEGFGRQPMAQVRGARCPD
jgi:hypothetical protein